MKTKILYLYVHLGYGGAEVGLLTTLRKIDRSKFDVTVVSIERRSEVGGEIERLGFKVIYLDSKARLYNAGLLIKVARILRSEAPDILHTSLFYANFFGRLASLFARPRAVVSEERSMYTEKRFYHVMLDNMLARITDRIIVCSESVLDFTSRQERINRDKFFLIYNSVDESRFDAGIPRSAARKHYGLSENDFAVGSVGSLIPKKGHRFLIEALSGLSRDIPGLKLLLVGSGESQDDLKGMVSGLNMDAQTVFMGERNDVPDIMRAIDVFVLPSLQEGFPRTLLEAMYTGLPVVASNISGIPELIRDGANGFLVSPGDVRGLRDRIRALYRDPDLRSRVSSAAKKTVGEGYMSGDYVTRLQGLYGTLLGAAG